MIFLKTTNAILSSALVAMLSLFSGASSAQQLSEAQSQGTTQASPVMQELAQARNEIQQLNEALQAIQASTIDNSDDLQAKLDEYQTVLDSSMKENGFDATEVRARLNAIVEKVQSGEIAQEEQVQLRQEYQKHAQSLQVQQQKAMELATVRQAYTSFSGALLSAMKKQDPNTEQLMAQLNSAQKQYQAMVQQVMQAEAQGDN
jgi:chromosome segregation ATPase